MCVRSAQLFSAASPGVETTVLRLHVAYPLDPWTGTSRDMC